MRVVSLLPSATEILFAVGAGDDVVAVTHECDYPPSAQRLPRVTANVFEQESSSSRQIDRHITQALHQGSAIYNLDSELLASLKPDLIVTQELCEVCAVSYQTVQSCVRRLPGDVEILSLEPATLEDILLTLVTVGRATGHEAQALSVVRSLRERMARVAQLNAIDPVPRVAGIEWTDPLMPGGHWVPEMVRLAGGEDVLWPEATPSTYIEWQKVLDAAPEVMVLMPCGFGLQKTLELAEEVTRRPGFEQLPCARSGRVFAVDGSSFFNRPGPRIVDGLEMLAQLFRAAPGSDLPVGSARVDLKELAGSI